ncbi:MAG TPA: nucleotidyltransferase family protein [Thiobacillaceae bacterium]|nr:nucleotidyltransferase family protein [Thiobacillaceae bacterium]
MSHWRDVLVAPDDSIRDTVRAIDAAALQIALVADADGRLLGTVTDGDVRRGILSGVGLDEPVRTIMNPEPYRVREGEDNANILAMMKQHRIHQLPVVNGSGVLVGLETLDDLLKPVRRDNPVVLMAGGLGTRLAPLTNERPKPMLHVGDRPILETILQNFMDYGFHRFYISVNYKAEMVREHFGDGSRWGVDIRYLHERERLGTAGALSLLEERPTLPLLVMNGDIMTRVNFESLMEFHLRNQAVATLGVREFSHTVPFGVVRMDGNRLLSLVEKPVEKVFVSAGIYVLQPEVLDLVPPNRYFDMPTLFQELMDQGLPTVGFPIHEYWLDIGRMEDFERAHTDYWSIFDD